MSTETVTPSVLTKHQVRTYGPKPISGWGGPAVITATVRYDDQCGNGHNTFSITGSIDATSGRDRDIAGGMLHEEIAKAFPELAPILKWHLCSSDGPMYYIENTAFHVSEGNLDYARSTAIWPEASDKDLTDPLLAQRLIARKPALMAEFRSAVESLGFTY